MSYNINEPFKLRKQFRHEEENKFIIREMPWQKSIIDLDNGKYLGRTPKRWFYLVFFYICFYGGLMLFSAFCYLVFDGTIEYQKPKWNLDQPGLSLEPSINIANFDVDINYHMENDVEVSHYVDHLEISLSKYGTPKEFGPCSSDEAFGYKTGQPCIFLKINRIIGFRAECLEDPNKLPQEAPSELFSYLSRIAAVERKDRIWVTCQSRPEIAMEFYPQRYFDATLMYAPEVTEFDASQEYIDFHGYINAKFYDQNDFKRIIAVQLQQVQPNIKHRVMCSLWAKNIKRNLRGKMGQGLVRFELMIRSDKK